MNTRKWVCKRYKIHPFIAALQWAVECCISIFFRCRKFDQVIIKRWDLRWCLSWDAKQNHLIFNPKILSNLRWNATSTLMISAQWKNNVDSNDYCQAPFQIQSRSIPGPFLIYFNSFQSIPIQNQMIWTRSWCYFHCATTTYPTAHPPSKLLDHIPDCSIHNCSISRQK